ncbi:hypothetical protein HZS_2779 [Henneguya salminicola]|nr:hypothetical protein HZS_2779 [Henneguya salminicola]
MYKNIRNSLSLLTLEVAQSHRAWSQSVVPKNLKYPTVSYHCQFLDKGDAIFIKYRKTVWQKLRIFDINNY